MPDNQPQREGPATNGTDGAGAEQQQLIDPVPSLQGIESSIRDLVAKGDGTEQDRNNRDLAAQEEMAKWAFWMFIASALGVVLTFCALLAIIRTLHHTKVAAQQSVIMADQAQLATKAAQDAVHVTERMGQAQVRAYLTVTSAKIRYVPGQTVAAFFTLTNTGQSPAYSVKVVYRVHADSGGIALTAWGGSAGTVDDVSDLIGAGAQEQFQINVISENGSTLPPLARLVIECALEYQTVFDRGTEVIDDQTRFRAIHNGAVHGEHPMALMKILAGAWYEVHSKGRAKRR